MAVFSIERVVETSDQPRRFDQSERVALTDSSHWVVHFDDRLVTRTERAAWVFLWYGEANAEPDYERVVDLLSSGHMAELWGCRGILIAINSNERSIYLFNDGYGAFPVYWSNKAGKGALIVSGSLKDFAREEIDWVSFYQFLSLGYVFGPYSLFKDVSRLSPNHGLKLLDGSFGQIVESFPLKNFWAGSAPASIHDLIDIFREEAEGFGDTQLMMSGGWDSRLLLSVLEHKKPQLYTHGNLQSREIAIVRELASACGLPLEEHSFDPAEFHLDLFREYLHRNESAMFSHWHGAGVFADSHKRVLTAGTFGEVLGGHYGTLNTLPGKKKHASLLMHMLGIGALLDNAMHLHDQQTVLRYLRMSNYRVLWFVQERLADELRGKELIEKSNQRLGDLFKSYNEQGMTDAQAMFERFYTEHRGGQYINRQLTNAARGNQFRNIFTNRELLAAAPSLPFSRRAHNKINKEIIKKLNPKLLDFPMAATLANARRPLLVQEGSRAARKIVESNTTMNTLYRKYSRFGDRSFGWNNFRDIVNPDWVQSLQPLLSSNLWDHQKLANAIFSDTKSNMYPFFDMISKAVTLDYLMKDAGR